MKREYIIMYYQFRSAADLQFAENGDFEKCSDYSNCEISIEADDLRDALRQFDGFVEACGLNVLVSLIALEE